ncbi:hypothetical protein D3C75_1016390 [compost metagenome]
MLFVSPVNCSVFHQLGEFAVHVISQNFAQLALFLNPVESWLESSSHAIEHLYVDVFVLSLNYHAVVALTV